MTDDPLHKDTDSNYPGRILSGAFSSRLKSHIVDCITALQHLDRIGNPAITYISAWHDENQDMWYEYLSPRFTGLLSCNPMEFAPCFRNSILERRVYRQGKTRQVETQIIANGDMFDARGALRNEGKANGLVEAIYKVALPHGRSAWLKDQAAVESFAEDGILLSSGCLTDVSKEMEAEASLKRIETALQKANLELQRMATQDGLTQVANRRRLDAWLDTEWRRLAREKAPLSIIMCDIDYFKRYNDTYGHQAGDTCLKRIAEAIARTARRASDLVARYGGEEFFVALPHTTIDGAERVAQEIRETVAQLKLPHASSPASPVVTLSMGIATTIPTAGENPATLIGNADQALYEAKKGGRDRFIRCL